MARMSTVTEKSTSFLTLTFTDENDAAVTPTSGSYRIDDELSGTQITADTSFVPTGSSHTLEITDLENVILSQANARETRIVTVSIAYGDGKKLNQEYKYQVVNLAKIS